MHRSSWTLRLLYELQPHSLTQLADSENDKERAAATEYLAKDKPRGPPLLTHGVVPAEL